MRKTTSNDFYHSVLGGGTGADARAGTASLTDDVGLRHLAQLGLLRACYERVFALLKNLFGKGQVSALADYVQAALILNHSV